MKTKTWWMVNKNGGWIGSVEAVSWTDLTITTACVSLPGCYTTHAIRSTDGDNYFDNEQQAIEHSIEVVAGSVAKERLVWA